MTLPILGTSVVTKEAMKQLLSQRNPNPPMEVIDIYYELESMWGIRADVLIGQMFHETDFLKSWWSQPPRRNMAGIGVTGEVTNSDPQSVAWAFKSEDNRWYKGYSFSDWRAAVLAHYGHMSAYCFADERNHASQVDPRYSAARGAFAAKGWPLAQVMTDLNGKWAVPGNGYGESIEQTLNVAASLPVSHPTPPPAPDNTAAPPPLFPPPEIIDLSAHTPPTSYTASRAPHDVKVLVLHDTVGGSSSPDRNDLPLDADTYQHHLNNALSWFQGGGPVSVHYLIGPEALGGKVYRLCPESAVAYHAGGAPGWTAPDGTHYQGTENDIALLNYISLGIHRWGAVNETPGPNQTNALLALVRDIARRYSLSTQQIVSHKELDNTRSDGEILLSAARDAVTQMWAAIVAGSAPQPEPAPSAQPDASPTTPPEDKPQDLSFLVQLVPLDSAPHEPSPITILPAAG
jgi:hypothetical protein